MRTRAAGVAWGLLVFAWTASADAQKSGSAKTEGRAGQFGGPQSVGGQIASDHATRTRAFLFEGLGDKAKPYYDLKERMNDELGLAFGVDYAALYQGASDSLGEDQAAGGVVRAFGTWTLFGRESGDTGSLTFKGENRHRIGTDIAPQALAGEIGYAGLTSVTFSDAGWLLTNLYWQQNLLDNRLAFIAGIVDVTDYVDVYALVNPWTDFSNLAFGTNPTIPAPNQGLGAAVRVLATDQIYLLAGFADANGDPSSPADTFQTFFDEGEYFSHAEIGWISSFEKRFTDNIHLTAWHADPRQEADTDEGWGLAMSFSREFAERWIPFARLGYANGGGAPLERSVSAGVGYKARGPSDLLAFGVNWGQPADDTYGADLDDQVTAELLYRLQLFPHTTLTPDIQLIIDPALNPSLDLIWVGSLRARVTF